MASVPPSMARNVDGPLPPLNFPPSFRAFFEQAESTVAETLEKAVAGPTFATFLAQATENLIALGRIASDSADLVVSNLRIAGRRDVVRLEQQLGRAEDKLEVLLQEVEGLRDELAKSRVAAGPRRETTLRAHQHPL